MEPGAPWRNPRQGYVYEVGSAMQMQMQLQQLADAATGGGVLKRSLGELEVAAPPPAAGGGQQELYLRTVRQRTAAAVDIAALLGGTPGARFLVLPGSSFGGDLASPSSTLSSLTTASRAAVPLMQPQRQVRLMTSSPQTQAFGLSRMPPLPQPTASSELFILQELEKLMLDDDEPVAAMSGAAAPSPGLPAAVTPNNNNVGMTRSPSNSSSEHRPRR